MSEVSLLLIHNNPSLKDMFDSAFAEDYRLVCKSTFERVDASAIEPSSIAVVDTSIDPVGAIEAWTAYLRSLQDNFPNLKIILISRPALRAEAHQLIRSGLAYDVIFLPLDLEALQLALQRVRYVSELENRLRDSGPAESMGHQELADSIGEMIGHCDQMKSVFSLITKAAKAEVHCLFKGQPGTGKLCAAKSLHKLRGLSEQTFVTIHGGLDPDLVNARLAEITAIVLGINRKPFSRERAQFDNGSIFIEDVHRLHMSQQLQVMRLAEESAKFRLAAHTPNAKRLYLLSGTSEDLSELVAKGLFRQDLYYYLSEIEVRLPTLHERERDVAILADYFLRQYRSQKHRKIRGFKRSAVEAMLAYQWPGNIDELQNRIMGAITFADSELISAKNLGFDGYSSASVADEKNGMSQIAAIREVTERQAVMDALRKCDGNISKAAKLLGISRPTLYDKMRQFKI